MRNLAAAITAVLLAGALAVAPVTAGPVSAATAPKVVIIIGATHGTTSEYRTYGDLDAAEALKYTPNVVKVYSPNATWAAVKAAVRGANIVVYHGHGNGWPSPYTFDAKYTTKDGFGLNATAGAGDSNTTYYGEPFIDGTNQTDHVGLALAPNAVVLLGNVCYSPGKGEAGQPEPSIGVAQERVSNFASAFIRAGARAVIADHAITTSSPTRSPTGIAYYLKALLSSHQTVEQAWRAAPNYQHHEVRFQSTRNAGYTGILDPEFATSGYKRSIVLNPTLTTDQVTGALVPPPVGDTVAAGLNAAPMTDAPLYADADDATTAGTPLSILPAGTRLHVDAREADLAAPDGSGVFRVHSIDGRYAGWMAGSALAPGDNTPPTVTSADAGAATFSPNGDGVQDSLPVTVRLSESTSWTMKVADAAGTQLAASSGTGTTAALTWAPAKGTVADGTYTWSLRAVDAWGNGPVTRTGSLIVDTRAPALTVGGAATPMPLFAPNGDGLAETVSWGVTSSEAGTVVAIARTTSGATAATVQASVTAATARTLAWSGKTNAGAYVADGVYAVSLVARDRAGNPSVAQVRNVAVYGVVKSPAMSTRLFYPQDGDAVAASMTMSYTLLRPATITWTIVDAAGATVRTIVNAAPRAAATWSYVWNGRDNAGAYVRPGTYYSYVRATNGTLAWSTKLYVRADAFAVTASDTTPARGQAITVDATTAEALKAAPVVTVTQPGVTAWNVTLARVGTTAQYRATVTLKPGVTGTLRLRVAGYDAAGHRQESTLLLPLH